MTEDVKTDWWLIKVLQYSVWVKFFHVFTKLAKYNWEGKTDHSQSGLTVWYNSKTHSLQQSQLNTPLTQTCAFWHHLQQLKICAAKMSQIDFTLT